MKTFIKSLFIILFITLLCAGCSPNSDSYLNLPGGFSYRDEGGDNSQILGKKGHEIYGKIVSFDYDDKFIIIAQNPSLKNHISMISFYLADSISKVSNNSIGADSEGRQLADSIVKFNPYYRKIFLNKINYWVIDVKNDKVIGPCNIDQFNKFKKQLNISNKLDINKIH